MDMLNFDATQVAPSTGEYEPVPNGRYALQVIEGEMKVTAEGQGTGVSLKIQVADGEYQGRTFYQFYNIKHPNETAQKIGQGEFSALCHATAVLQPKAPSEFFNRIFLGDVKVTQPTSKKQADGTTKNFGAGNSISKYYRADGTGMNGVVGAIAPSAAPTAKKTITPPWAAKAS